MWLRSFAWRNGEHKQRRRGGDRGMSEEEEEEEEGGGERGVPARAALHPPAGTAEFYKNNIYAQPTIPLQRAPY